MVQAFECVLPDVGDGLVSVRGPGRVAQIDDVLVRELVNDRPSHGESTEAGVEDADRRFGIYDHGRRA